MNSAPTLILDVFGTIAHITRPHRAFSGARDAIGNPSDFGRVAMTEKHNLVSICESYGGLRHGPLPDLEMFLLDELASVRLFPEVAQVISGQLARGHRVVLGSNLAYPFACALEPLLAQIAQWEPIQTGQGNALLAYSFDMGRIKPEASFYQDIENRLGKGPYFMTGDRQEEDCLAPAREGWKSHWLRRDLGENLRDAIVRLGLDP